MIRGQKQKKMPSMDLTDRQDVCSIVWCHVSTVMKEEEEEKYCLFFISISISFFSSVSCFLRGGSELLLFCFFVLCKSEQFHGETSCFSKVETLNGSLQSLISSLLPLNFLPSATQHSVKNLRVFSSTVRLCSTNQGGGVCPL